MKARCRYTPSVRIYQLRSIWISPIHQYFFLFLVHKVIGMFFACLLEEKAIESLRHVIHGTVVSYLTMYSGVSSLFPSLPSFLFDFSCLYIPQYIVIINLLFDNLYTFFLWFVYLTKRLLNFISINRFIQQTINKVTFKKWLCKF